MSEPSSLRVLSLGAGVQSTTLALMAAAGEIETPDCAIFADTQAEPGAVYEHVVWLKSVLPFPVNVVTHGNLAEDSLKIRTSKRSGKRYRKTMVPLYVQAPSGARGLLWRECTTDYKVRPIADEIKRLIGPNASAECWIGISTDEAHRMKPSSIPHTTNRWPLIEAGMSRGDCIEWLKRHGYREPAKSACIFCPYHNDRHWLEMKRQQPEEFAAAAAWEARMHAEPDEVLRGTPYLHHSCVPLGEAVFDRGVDERQLDLFGNECEGMCGV